MAPKSGKNLAPQFFFVLHHFLLSLSPQTNTGKMFNHNTLFNTNNPLAD